MFLGVCKEVQTLPPFVELPDGQNSQDFALTQSKVHVGFEMPKLSGWFKNPNHDI